jgi:hypothetical protein
MALPAFVPGSGPCLGRTGRIAGDPGPAPGRRAALAALYGALVVELMLERLDARGPLIVEGSFHANAAFCSLLAALRPTQPVHPTDDPSGTAAGAWLLARWGQTRPPAAFGATATPLQVPGLAAYRRRWREEAAG